MSNNICGLKDKEHLLWTDFTWNHQVGQTETSSEVNPTITNLKQMSMEVRAANLLSMIIMIIISIKVKMDEVKGTRLMLVVNTLGVFGRESDEVLSSSSTPPSVSSLLSYPL